LTPTGLLSTEATQLKFLSDIPSAQPVLAILAKEKLISSFGPRLAEHINPVTGRIHCDYNIAAQKAGRCTASNPNLQQLPSRRDPAFKGCLRAAEGYVMVGGDYGQVELRGGAWLSHDRALTRVFAENRDLHIETAAKIARIPVDMVTKVQRDAAKPVNYGAVYGIGAATLVINAFADYGIVLTLAEAQHALDAFFAAFPQLAQWRFDNYNTCKARGFVRIGCGRVVEAAWEPGGLRFTQCCNLPIQGICADCIMRAITMVHLRLRAARVRGGLVASVHDELLLEVHEDDAEKARTILEETMIEAFTITFPGAPITGLLTAKIGTNWSEVK
jgi:DNA polymerase I-like protein with 3'-5' exonuclease and polymerase domains